MNFDLPIPADVNLVLVVYVVAVVVNVCTVAVSILYRRKDEKGIVKDAPNNTHDPIKAEIAQDRKVLNDGKKTSDNIGNYTHTIIGKAEDLEHKIDELNQFFGNEFEKQKQLIEDELQTYKKQRTEQIESNIQVIFHKVITDVLAVDMTEEMEAAQMKKFLKRFKQEVYEK